MVPEFIYLIWGGGVLALLVVVIGVNLVVSDC